MSRDPQNGRPLDCYALSEGGFYQYQATPSDWANPDAPQVAAVEDCVPPAAIYSARGRWFTEERAQQLLSHEALGAQ